MALSPRLVTVSCFGTLVKRTSSRGNQYRQVLQKAFPEFADVPSAAALSSSYKKAFREQSVAAPNFGTGTPGGSKIWWQDVMRSTLIEAGAPSLVSAPGFDSACDELYNNLHKQWEMFPTTEPALDNLRSWCDKHDCRLGVVANMDDRLPGFLHKLGIDQKFDFILSSYDCGFEQPEPYIYYSALHAASVPPSAFADTSSVPALHCGHLAMDDLHGALGAGFAAMLVNSKFPSLGPLQQMITEWQSTANAATRAWHSPHLGLTMGLLAS
jgi:FMN phosphatase YigB (HAD superfamily)